jgi:hypothetical protein
MDLPNDNDDDDDLISTAPDNTMAPNPAALFVDPPTDPSPLAQDLDLSLEVLVNDLDLDGPAGMDPTQAAGMLRPAMAQAATKRPEQVIGVLAVLHCETGRLIEEHADEPPEVLASEAQAQSDR